ncbi:MAG: hypothetical protein ABIH76_00610 [Candidatus Bathyarchaeota archaeon]
MTHSIYVTTQQRGLSLLRKLINISASSLKIHKLTVTEPYRQYNLRPQVHLFISAPYGEFKSTLLSEVQENYPSKLYTHLTFPSLIGSIDKSTKQVIPAAAWEACNKLLLLDEFTATRPSLVTETLLQLLEGQSYSRKIAVWSPVQNNENGDLYFRVKDGSLEVKTRFAAIIATMKNIKKSSEYTFKALLSRCVPFRYELSKAELDQVLDGMCLFEKQEYETPEEITISIEDYKHIRKMLDDEASKSRRDIRGIFARCVGDCCRVFAVLGAYDDELYREILRLKASYC